MKCDCCAKKKGLLEVFEPITDKNLKLNLCVDCCTMIYKLRDAQKEQNNEVEVRLLKDILSKKKKSSDDFTKWFTEKYLHNEIKESI